MKPKRTIRTLSHCFYDLKYHFVWTPKYRGDVLTDPKVKQEIRIIEIITKWKHWELVELNIQDDHIHMILILLPKDSPSYAMQIIKGKSSAWIKKRIKHKSDIYEKHSVGMRGYFVSTIGIDELIVRRYVRHQDKHNQIDQSVDPNIIQNFAPIEKFRKSRICVVIRRTKQLIFVQIVNLLIYGIMI